MTQGSAQVLTQGFNGILWLLILIGPLLILQRGLHREIQAIFFILTRRADVSMGLFAILFFPGVLLHEGSHFLMARLLGVRTGRFSLLPRPLPNGRMQLGFVETAAADWVRDALIGAAPLVAGGLCVAYIGIYQLGLPAIWMQVRSGNLQSILQGFSTLYAQPDFWLWFYLTFTISSTMLPSASDRRAWLPLALVAGGLLGLSLLAGAGPWLLENLAPILNRLLLAVASVFGISVFVHFVLLLPAFALRLLLSWLSGAKLARGRLVL